VKLVWDDLVAIETREVAPYAAALADAYNHPLNAPLLSNTVVMTAGEVAEHFAEVDHPFVLLRDGALAGDGDLRGVRGDACELAFLICDPAAQGKGLGTRFATMMLVAAFAMGLQRVFASIVPANVASRRVFEKLGYVATGDRAYADEPDDIVMVIDRATFERVNAAAIRAIVTAC
jgi:RimJ/RimL family protein N-acetyltransferase